MLNSGKTHLQNDLNQRLSEQKKILAAFYEVSKTVNQSLDLDQTLNISLEQVKSILNADTALIRLLDEDTNELKLVAHSGFAKPESVHIAPHRKFGKGSAWQCVMSGQPYIQNRPREDSTIMSFSGIRSSVTIPLKSKGRVMGTMGVHQRTARDFLPEEIELMANIGSQVGMAIENARLYTKLQQISNDLSALNFVSETVNRSLDMNKMLEGALDSVIKVLRADGGFIRLLDSKKQELFVASHKGFTPDQIKLLKKRRKFGDGINWKVFQSGKAQFVEHRPEDLYLQKIGSFGLKIGAHFSILFPLKSKEKPYGTMAIFALSPRRFKPEEIELCSTIGNQIGTAIENAMLLKSLAESEKKYKNLFENSGEALFVIDPDGRFNIVNQALEKITGYSRKELIGQHFKKIVAPDHLDFIQGIFDSGFEHFSTLSAEIEVIDRTGEPHIIELLKGSFRVEESGKLIGYLVTARDLTERKRIEEKLLQSAKLQSLGELAAGVAHDFNNSLLVILGHTELLQIEVEDERIQAKLDIIRKAVLNAAETVNKIKNFTRVKPEKEEFKPFELNAIIENARELTSSRWEEAFQKEGLPFQFEIDLGDVPPLNGNALELQQAFINIFLNSLDAMPKGGHLSVKTEFVPYRENTPVKTDDRLKGMVQITITDSGTGMNGSTINKIFDPFFTTKGVKRMGLGLTNTYGTIKRHQGDVQVKSRQGKGTRFVVTLPVYSTETEMPQALSPRRGEPLASEVLVVDDDPENLNLLSELLSKFGCRVAGASSGPEGLEKYRMEGPFDIVFTDLGMPEMSGWELTSHLKNIDPQIPVVLITGWGSQLTKEELKDKKVDFILPKPFRINEITHLINQIRGGRQG